MQWIYLMYFNVILSKMSKETPKIQSKLTDLEKVGWNRLGHRLSFLSFVYFSVFVTLFPDFLLYIYNIYMHTYIYIHK